MKEILRLMIVKNISLKKLTDFLENKNLKLDKEKITKKDKIICDLFVAEFSGKTATNQEISKYIESKGITTNKYRIGQLTKNYSTQSIKKLKGKTTRLYHFK